MATINNLNDDMIYELYQQAPDWETCRLISWLCKRFYNVFQIIKYKLVKKVGNTSVYWAFEVGTYDDGAIYINNLSDYFNIFEIKSDGVIFSDNHIGYMSIKLMHKFKVKFPATNFLEKLNLLIKNFGPIDTRIKALEPLKEELEKYYWPEISQ